jgi:uncharacterized iron-regulated membrane protein
MRSDSLAPDALFRPRWLAIRRAVFQIHRWAGLGLGLYLILMSLTGVALLFEEEYLVWRYPGLYRLNKADAGDVRIDALLDTVQSRYPNRRIWQVQAPTATRDTYLINVEGQGGYRRVFADASGRIVGELPVDSFMLLVKRVHGNLYSLWQGRRINGVLGLATIVLAASGAVVWWPGIRRAWRSLGVTWSGGWLTVTRRLHGAVGIWSFAFIVMFALTGAYFCFDAVFYRLLGGGSAQSNPPSPQSDAALSDSTLRPQVQALIARAEEVSPGKRFWALFPPASAAGAIQIVLGPADASAAVVTRDFNATGQRFIYFDQYSGEPLAQWDVTNPTLADAVRSWARPLHRGSFDGGGVKILWVAVGLAPSILFVAGVAMWWARAFRPWLGRRAARRGRR